MTTYQPFFIAFLFFSTNVFGQDISFSISGYDMHVEINLETYSGADRYEIWKKDPDESTFYLDTTTRQLRLQDWTGRTDDIEVYSYFTRALSVTGNILATSDTLSASVMQMSDEQFLDMVQAYTFRYFWEYAHPVSGMARERLGSDDVVTTGGTGFGVMSIIVGVHRGLITREQAVDRLLQLVSFLQFADRFHGVFPHWMNGETGEAYAFGTFDNGGDLVETAFLIQGLLAARTYFDQDIPTESALRDVITGIWEDVEWDHYSRNNSGVLYWHWSPDFAWQMNFPIRGYNEALIIYLLAIASPTHSVPASYWHSGWAGGNYVSNLSWYGHKLFVGPPLGGPLFFAHYSYMGFDPRNKKDSYANYFLQNTNQTLINRAWCIDNPLAFEGYGENSWGLTASDDPWGYFAHAPGGVTDNGTLTPAAAIPSMPYTPELSIEVVKHFYRVYGKDLWGPFGFYDAFNPEEDWFADSYIAIDQGPIINMIENHRSGLLWDAFMANPEIDPALDAIGFVEDITSTNQAWYNDVLWTVFPTTSSDQFNVSINDLNANWTVQLSDQLGRPVDAIITTFKGDKMYFIIEPQSYSGWMWVSIVKNLRIADTRVVWVK